MQIGDDALQSARQRERASALGSSCWMNCTKGRQGFVGRFLCILQMPPPMTGGSLEQRMSKGKFKIDFYSVVQDGSWDWLSDFGWPALAVPVRGVSRSRSPAPSQVVAKAAPRASPKATPPTTKPFWAVVTNAFPRKYQLQRGGCNFYHARTIIQRLGLRTWCAHLVDKIPMCQTEFACTAGIDFVQDPGGLPGVPP